MPLVTKEDDVLWLKHLRAVGIQIDVGEAACFTINGARINFEPMRPDRNGRPTHGLKATLASLPNWNAIPKGAQMALEPCPTPSARTDEAGNAERAVSASPIKPAAMPRAASPSTRQATGVTVAVARQPTLLAPRSRVPSRGSVCGIDVGYSEASETTGFCILGWDQESVTWHCNTARTDEDHRRQRLGELTPINRGVNAVAVDGPLVPGLALYDDYRSCEAILTQGVMQKRGKPGPTNGGSGPRLHAEATRLAHFALSELEVQESSHRSPIHARAVVEAFPNLLLGALCDENDYPEQPDNARRWTDALYPRVQNRLECLLASLLPERRAQGQWNLTGHEDIASFACAITALCVTANLFTAVGSDDDGWIVLPPRHFLGSGWESTLVSCWGATLRRFPRARILW